MLVFALRNQYKGHESTCSSKVLLTKTLSVLFLALSSVISGLHVISATCLDNYSPVSEDEATACSKPWLALLSIKTGDLYEKCAQGKLTSFIL